MGKFFSVREWLARQIIDIKIYRYVNVLYRAKPAGLPAEHLPKGTRPALLADSLFVVGDLAKTAANAGHQVAKMGLRHVVKHLSSLAFTFQKAAAL